MRSQLGQRLAQACEQDNSIVVHREEAHTSQGFSTEYLNSLGLSKTDLKLLERAGLALRGWTKNIWRAGEKGPNGNIVPEGFMFKGRGHRVRWVLIVPKELENDVQRMQAALPQDQNSSG